MKLNNYFDFFEEGWMIGLFGSTAVMAQLEAKLACLCKTNVIILIFSFWILQNTNVT